MDLGEKNHAKYRHPWELSRTDVILNELAQLKIAGDVLDIGCGDRYFDKKMLRRFPAITSLWGVDINAKTCIHKGKEHYVNSYQEIEMSGEKQFDYIFMMDVLEHIKNDIGFMEALGKYQKDHTVIFMTVPAFQALYSLHDRQLHHFRRYNYRSLQNVLEQSGYQVMDWSYFYFSLIVLRCLTKNQTQNLGMWKRGKKDWLTVTARTCLNIDFTVLRFLSKHHIHVGGLSLMAVCRKRKRSNEKDKSGYSML